MCQWGETITLFLKIDSRLAAGGVEKWKPAKIDSCIAPLVAALQNSGIDMLSSCCGHGDVYGHISLADGRDLLIVDTEYGNRTWLVKPIRWAFRMMVFLAKLRIQRFADRRGWRGPWGK